MSELLASQNKKNPTRKKTKWCNNMLNKRIRELLKDKNAKIDDFSAFLSVSNETVRLWTTGYARPDMDKLIAISEYFGVSIGYLLGTAEVENPDDSIQAINIGTGLSESAINHLIELNNKEDKFELEFLNYFLSDKEFLKNLKKLLMMYYVGFEEKQDEYFKEQFLLAIAKDSGIDINKGKYGIVLDKADIAMATLSRIFEKFIEESYNDFYNGKIKPRLLDGKKKRKQIYLTR